MTCLCVPATDSFAASSEKLWISVSVDNIAQSGLVAIAEEPPVESLSSQPDDPPAALYNGDCSMDSNNFRSEGPGAFLPNSSIEM